MRAQPTSHIPKSWFRNLWVVSFRISKPQPVFASNLLGCIQAMHEQAARRMLNCLIVSASRSPPGLGSDTASRSPPGRGHRFAQVFHSLCATLLHFCVNSGPFLTQFFVLWGHFWRTRGPLLSIWNQNRPPWAPPCDFPRYQVTFWWSFWGWFWVIFTKEFSFAGVIFSVVSQPRFFMVSCVFHG